MAFDPYGNAPGRDELKKSGTEDWVNEAVSSQKAKETELLAVLGQESATIEAGQKDLESLLELPPEGTGGEPPAPDLFAQERAEAEKQRAALSNLMGDFEANQAAEREALKNLFGN